MREAIKKASETLGIPEATVEKVYKAFWLFIRKTVEGLPLKEDLTEEEFKRLRTNFNLPSLGKLTCDYSRWERIKNLDKIKAKKKENYNGYQKD